MGKIVTIHQPNYLPWIGLFSKISKVDCFIIYDTAQYTKNSVINRNKVRANSGWCYLTLPINRNHVETKIYSITLPEDNRWRHDHWLTIYNNYAKTPFFKDYMSFFEQLYLENFQYLWQLNEKILLYLLECFDIKVDVQRASELITDPGLHQTDAIIALLKSVGAEVYISGPTGRTYLEFDKFYQNRIDVKFIKFQHPVYKQRYPGFEPNMSAIDLLFNMGPQAGEIIKGSGNLEEEPVLNSER